MITKFKLFEENHNYQIGDIVYCIDLPSVGLFYKNRPYEIIQITSDGGHFQLKDITNNKEITYWVMKERL